MIIHYPTYFLVPVMPVTSLNEDEYILRYDMEGNELPNTYRNINKDIFREIDEEYVNKIVK